MTLFDELSGYARSGAVPMHMPGHKRNTAAFPWLKGLAERDITEIQGFDDLNDPRGVFRETERAAARLWGAGESIALVGGSTLGILASVLSVLEGGGELLMCRASHRSVYHAAQLAGARTRYLTPRTDRTFGIPLSVTPDEVARALDSFPGVGLVCVTSPTYEGVISDTAGIARECRRRGVPLLVDQAHGAHLGFGGFLAGAAPHADLTVQSLHKTLPSLTQTALLHVNGGLVDPEKVRRYVGMLQSSSPSYLLSGSVDGCVAWLAQAGEKAAEEWLGALRAFRQGAGELRNIRLWESGGEVFDLDPSKLLFTCGGDLGGRLRRDFGIEPEYARGALTLCMTGMGDTRESLGLLLDSLLSLDRELAPAGALPLPPSPLPRQVMTVREAMTRPGALLPLREALGHAAGEYAWAYPPGIPCLVPGEIVDGGVLEALKASGDLRFTCKHGPDSIFCVDLPEKIV